MGPSPTYHPPEGEECETSVEHGLPLWAEPAVGYCSRRARPSPMWGSRFVGARAVGPWVGEQKPLGSSPLQCNPSPESTYLPTYLPGPHPAHVVFTPASRAADILPLLAATRPGQRILLAANASVLSDVLIGHADALHVHPLLPDLHVAYAPGTPVDPSVWDSQ